MRPHSCIGSHWWQSFRNFLSQLRFSTHPSASIVLNQHLSQSGTFRIFRARLFCVLSLKTCLPHAKNICSSLIDSLPQIDSAAVSLSGLMIITPPQQFTIWGTQTAMLHSPGRNTFENSFSFSFSISLHILPLFFFSFSCSFLFVYPDRCSK